MGNTCAFRSTLHMLTDRAALLEVIFTIISFASLASLGFGFAVTEAAVVSALFLAFLQARRGRAQSTGSGGR